MRKFCLWIVLLSSFSFLPACGGIALGKFGSADMTYRIIKAPAGIKPKVSRKTDIINILGMPDSVVKDKKKETWIYQNQVGFYILVFGKTMSKDLVINFVGDKVDSYHLVNKGESMGILTPQGGVSK